MADSPEKQKINFSLNRPTPVGEDLLGALFESVEEGLVARYPATKEFRGRFITRDLVVTLPTLDDVAQKELDEQRPEEDSLLYRLSAKAGVPQSHLRNVWSTVNPENSPRYFNPLLDEPILYITEEDPSLFSSPREEVRRKALLNAYQSLIQIDLAIMAFSAERSKLPEVWRDDIKRHIQRDYFDPIVEKHYPVIDLDKLEEAKEAINGAIDNEEEGPRPAGAMVYLVLTGQDESRAEYTIGREFQLDILNYLYFPVAEAVFRSLQRKLIIPLNLRREISTIGKKRLSRATQILREMDFADTDQEEVLGEFMKGTIADLFRCRIIQPRLKSEDFNPFPYGELPVSGEVALDRYFSGIHWKDGRTFYIADRKA